MTTFPAKPRQAIVLPTRGRAAVVGGVARRSIELQVLPGAAVASAAADNAAASAAASAASAAAALVSENAAAASASAALTSENNAETAETNAETAQLAAENAQTAAENAQSASEAARDLAEEWAENPEDDEITGNPGSYSALHWAAKAEDHKTAAETAETNAETAETNAEAAQLAAENARDAALLAQTAAETAETNAETAETNAEAAQLAAENARDAALAAADSVRWESQGAYSGVTAYLKNDVVLDQGSSWVALQDTTGNAPPTLPTESNAYWQLVAKQGDPGTGDGTVTSVALSVPTGLSVSGSPITTSGTFAVSWASGYQGYTSAEAAALATALQPAAIGVSVQGYSAGLAAIAGLAVTDSNIIVGNGTTWVAESGATARTSLGLGTGNSPQFTGLNIGHASDTTLTRTAAGVVAVEGKQLADLATENLPLSGGATVTPKDLGTQSSGTLTLDMGDRPHQHYTNGGAHTLAPGAVNSSCLVDITNNGSAGAITTSGWTKVVGDSFTTTNGHVFRCHASVSNGVSLLVVQAMQ